jgi:hypothetical protein
MRHKPSCALTGARSELITGRFIPTVTICAEIDATAGEIFATSIAIGTGPEETSSIKNPKRQDWAALIADCRLPILLADWCCWEINRKSKIGNRQYLR